MTISHNIIEENGAAETDDHFVGGIAVAGVDMRIMNTVIRRHRVARRTGTGSFGAFTNLLLQGNAFEANIRKTPSLIMTKCDLGFCMGYG